MRLVSQKANPRRNLTARSDHRSNVTQPYIYVSMHQSQPIVLRLCCVTRTLVFCGCACALLCAFVHLPSFRSFPFLTYGRGLLRSSVQHADGPWIMYRVMSHVYICIVCYTACTQYVVSERNAAFLRREVLLSRAARTHARRARMSRVGRQGHVLVR